MSEDLIRSRTVRTYPKIDVHYTEARCHWVIPTWKHAYPVVAQRRAK